MANLNDFLMNDFKDIKEEKVYLEKGDYVGQFVRYENEPTYNRLIFNINGKDYGFFFNVLKYNSDELDTKVIAWLTQLGVLVNTKGTTIEDGLNDAIGAFFKINVSNYVSKKDDSTNHTINFYKYPELAEAPVEDTDGDDLFSK